MDLLEDEKDTICAIATASGVSGISVIRISGRDCVGLVRPICQFIPNEVKSHSVYYGFLREKDSGREVDEVLVSYFEKGRSFTGEETLEISCHGSSFLSHQILKELILVGCRLARPGEYTYRAFMNGRINLVQAESVLALIQSKSKMSSQMALRQLQGGLSKEFEVLETDLTWILANLEANIDFSEENLPKLSVEKMLEVLRKSTQQVDAYIKSYKSGRLLKEGLKIGIFGVPNVGKSSLLNLFAGEEKAIVTNQEGTTRDLIEWDTNIDGITVQFVDTAGLRETENLVEQIGVQRSLDLIKSVDIVFYMFELNKGLTYNELADLKQLPLEKFIFIGNKSDLVSTKSIESHLDESLCLLKEFYQSKMPSVEGSLSAIGEVLCVPISTVTRKGFAELRGIISRFGKEDFVENSAVIFQSRHFELLLGVQNCFRRAEKLFLDQISNEFIILELQEALLALYQITGKQYDDQVMDRVFNDFCIGK